MRDYKLLTRMAVFIAFRYYTTTYKIFIKYIKLNRASSTNMIRWEMCFMEFWTRLSDFSVK